MHRCLTDCTITLSFDQVLNIPSKYKHVDSYICDFEMSICHSNRSITIDFNSKIDSKHVGPFEGHYIQDGKFLEVKDKYVVETIYYRCYSDDVCNYEYAVKTIDERKKHKYDDVQM
ncbi:unnamed protein product [Didymodactylos carnosus]|uniref:Uncharacterized protein n=1 Tax=Didymodactylos carnosus TaxID=1234261 RepID=A0A814TW10_9BILA|nr:unnamed protein product [Didymodactylos carnosus]CAF3929204.1 unnamed protein product [Didymodactylos carnosus]